MSFQTRKTFIHLRNTNDEIEELSDPPLTATQLKCSQVQKRSKYTSKNRPCDISGSTVTLREYFFVQRKQK